MIRPIYLYGSAVLREEAQPVELTDKEGVAALVTDLRDTLKASDGVGLAAPQIGVSKRVVIVDGTDMVEMYPELKDFRRALVNPRIIEESEATSTFNEGCLSIPGIYCDVERPSEITVEYYDENLEKKVEHLSGFGCRMVQHELSHLDGDLFTDHVARIRKKIIESRLKKIARGETKARYSTKLVK